MSNKKDNLNISDKGWKIIDFTEIDENGISGKELLRRLQEMNK